MTKVLALLTLAVLAFSAMTGPAFAPPLGRSGVRSYGIVDSYYGRALRHEPRVDRELGRVLRPGSDLDLAPPPQGRAYLALRPPPPRPQGFLDDSIFIRSHRLRDAAAIENRIKELRDRIRHDLETDHEAGE